MGKITLSQVARRDYLLQRLDNKTDKGAKKELGIKGTRFSARLKAALERDCSIADAPRSGRPPIYTFDILDAALDWFIRFSWQELTKAEFVNELLGIGILPEGAAIDGFYPAFKAHLLGYGFHLKWGQQSFTFALSQDQKLWRAQWCQQHQGTFTTTTLGDYWFCDEIVIEEGGHPKGVL